MCVLVNNGGYQSAWSLHCESKKQDTKLLPITSPILTDFKTVFTGRLSSKFTSKLYLNIPPRLKHVSTQPCEIWLPKKWRQSEICIVINDKSQSSIAKHLKNAECFTTHLSLNFLVKEFLKLVNIWRSYRQNGDCFMRPFRIALLSLVMLISPDKLNNVCITDRNCYQSLLCQ